MMLIATYYIFI